jgi:hypothetical protein
MKKFKCLGCNSKSCYVEQEDDILTPCCCVHGWNGDTDWQEVKEVKAEEILNLPSWCKVGEVAFYTQTSDYCQIVEVDIEKGIKIQTDLSNGWVENFYDLLEARLRPFNESELRELVGKAIEGNISKRICLVVSCSQSYVSVYGYTYSNEELLDNFTFTDGTPCGVYEHKENGEWVK